MDGEALVPRLIEPADEVDAEMTDRQVLALLRRVSALRAEYQAAGYLVTHSAAEHPRWRTETAGA